MFGDPGPTWLWWWIGLVALLFWPALMLPLGEAGKIAAEAGWLALVGLVLVLVARHSAPRRAAQQAAQRRHEALLQIRKAAVLDVVQQRWQRRQP